MTLKPLRRVVTAHTEDGKSTILSDVAVAAVEFPFWPGRGIYNIWSIDRIPSDNTAAGLPEGGKPKSLPSRGGTAFHIMVLPPERDLQAMTEADRKLSTRPVTELAAHFVKRPHPRHYSMHATNSTDYIIVLEGEVTYLYDEGEIVLKKYDIVVQRGTHRGWVNHTDQPCIVAVAINSAEPLAL
jgi:hypothetical protein